MIEVIPTGPDDRVLGLRINGAIERADVETAGAALKEKLTRHKRVRIYTEIVDPSTVSPLAVIENLKVALRHFRDVERQAIVADAFWLDPFAGAADLIPGVRVRHFSWMDKGEALRWVKG
jgi:hypothetical protein